jgi:hypothetical protein
MFRFLTVFVILGVAACSSDDDTAASENQIQFIRCGGPERLECPDYLVCDAPPGEDAQGFCRRPPEDDKGTDPSKKD